jgi:tRNA uridine 5-carboxymethylaminomethyl modification enzyme
LQGCLVRPNSAAAAQIEQSTGQPIRREVRALDLLARPGVTYAQLTAVDDIGQGFGAVDGIAVHDPADDPTGAAGPIWNIDAAAAAEQLEIQAKYAGYVDRQRDEIERQRGQEAHELPANFDYGNVRGLSTEVMEKFQRVRPATIGQAARIPGVTPAAVSLLLIHLKRLSA